MNLIQKKSQLYFLIVLCLLLSDSAISQTWNLNGNAGTDPATMFIGTTDNKSFRIRTNNAIRMHINASGRVGIGNLSPVFKLDVKGGSINTDSLYRINGVAALSRDNTNRIQLGDGTVRVGIGTASPTTTLQVIGTVTATEFAGGGSGITGINANNIASGTLADARLSDFVALEYNSNIFSGSNVFTQDVFVNDLTVGRGGNNLSTNSVAGYQALTFNITGENNSAFGWKVLWLNQDGDNNTAIGSGALYSNTSGNNNTANGQGALYSNSVGESNTAIGSGALYSNTGGNNNTANGQGALYSNSFGESNTANGYQALYSNTTGNQNTANGLQALYSNNTGEINTANGYQALFSNTGGFSNTANGHTALFSNTTGNNNTANGQGALYSNNIGESNTANGFQALFSNTSGFVNTANGSSALYLNTTGFANTANGHNALFSNSTGSNNTANGCEALFSNTTGFANTANGYQALFSNLIGEENTANGFQALASNTNGDKNTANGQGALFSNTTGNNNTANGNFALFAKVSGNDVTAVGANSGDTWSNINQSVFVGSLSDATTNSLINATAIGYSAQVDASNKVRIGNAFVTSIGGQVAWTTFSDGRYKRNVEEDVPGLEFITKLRPVTYTSDITGLNNHYPKPALREGQRQAPDQDVTSQEDIRYSGFIAQEVETAAKEIGYDFSGVDKPQLEGNLYGLRYSDFVVPMVKAIQEQQNIIDEQQKEIDEQQKEIDALKSLITGNTTSGAIKIGVSDGRNEILLGQNIPNPADNSTIIPFSIPANCKSASILIADHATGRAIKAVPLSCKDTHLMLDAGSLASGTYSYTLFIDGASFDTKQMVIIK